MSMKSYILFGALLLPGLASTRAQEDRWKEERSPALGMPSEEEKKEAVKKIEKAEKKAEKEESGKGKMLTRRQGKNAHEDREIKGRGGKRPGAVEKAFAQAPGPSGLPLAEC